MRKPRKTCRHCGDPVPVEVRCPTCDTYLVRQCSECHAETAHGVIPPLATRPPGLPSPQEDAGPWQENAIRALEDGR